MVENGPVGPVPRPTPAAEHERHQQRRHRRIPTPSSTSSNKNNKSIPLVYPRAHDYTYTLLYDPEAGTGRLLQYILAHLEKDTSTQNTNFVVSLSYPTAYAMLATLANPIKVPLPTSTTTLGQIRQ